MASEANACINIKKHMPKIYSAALVRDIQVVVLQDLHKMCQVIMDKFWTQIFCLVKLITIFNSN